MEFLGVIGLLLSIVILIILVYKGYSAVPISLLASLVAILFSGEQIWEALSQGFNVSMMGFVGNYLILFFLGALLGGIISKSGAAQSIAIKLMGIFGKNNAILIVAVTAFILSYGGVSVFVIIFSIYPIGLFLFKEADIPRRLIPGVLSIGTVTTMVATPGSPALTNIIPTTFLGTTATAAPVIGIITTIVMFGSGLVIFNIYKNRIVANGERFVAGPNDDIIELTPEVIANLPSFFKSIAPIIVAIGFILGERILGLGLESVYAVNLGLALGCLTGVILFYGELRDKKLLLSESANGSSFALLNTASVVGFGGTLRQLPAFQYFIAFASAIPAHPYISSAIAVMIVAGVTGSSSAGITIFMETFAEDYLAMGINPEVLHRVTALAAATLDSLPHAGPNVTMLAVTGLTYKEGYPGLFLATVVLPIIGVAVAIVLAFMGIV